MAENLESHYLQKYRQIEALKAPLSFKNPSSIFVNRKSIINDINYTFGELNRVLSSLDLAQVKVDDYISKIESPRTDMDEIIRVMVNLNMVFQNCKGMCLGEVTKKMESIV